MTSKSFGLCILDLPPPSNSDKQRFTGIPYQKYSNPVGDDCILGGGYIYDITIYIYPLKRNCFLSGFNRGNIQPAGWKPSQEVHFPSSRPVLSGSDGFNWSRYCVLYRFDRLVLFSESSRQIVDPRKVSWTEKIGLFKQILNGAGSSTSVSHGLRWRSSKKPCFLTNFCNRMLKFLTLIFGMHTSTSC